MEILDFLKLGFSTLKQNPEVRDVDYQRTVHTSSLFEETQVELGVAPATECGAVREEDVAAHRGDGRVVADDVAEVPRLKEGQFVRFRKVRIPQYYIVHVDVNDKCSQNTK